MQSRITSLKELLKKLNGATKEEYKSIGAILDIPIQEFHPYAFWSEEHYTRNCILRKDNYELILLCWEPGQETPIHCHGGQECWVYMIDGMLEEQNYQILNEALVLQDQSRMRKGERSFMSDMMGYHSLANISPERSMSLHLYMNPIDECTIYNSETEKFDATELSYFSYEGYLISIES